MHGIGTSMQAHTHVLSFYLTAINAKPQIWASLFLCKLAPRTVREYRTHTHTKHDYTHAHTHKYTHAFMHVYTHTDTYAVTLNQTAMHTQASTVESNGASSSATGVWGDTSVSCRDTPVLMGLEGMLEFDEEENLCGICYDDLANASLKPCGHLFCSNCILQLKKRAVYMVSARTYVHGILCVTLLA